MSAAKKSMSRREQVKKAGSTVFVVVAMASVVVMFSVISMRFLWDKKNYNGRVISAKTKARDDIRSNIENLKRLAEQFPQLESSATANSKTILHALPPVYDYAALASSIDYLATVSGVVSDTNIGEDMSATAETSATISKPVELPLTLSVSGSYESIRQYILNLERSLRPVHITSVEYSGSNSNLQATLQATTYYQPVRSLDVLRSTIQ